MMNTVFSESTAAQPRIQFTKAGKKAFLQANASQGKSRLFFPCLAGELSEYIARHLETGRSLIEAFDVRYTDGIFLTVYCSGGVFFIDDVTNLGVIIKAAPVLVWKKVKRGIDYVIAHVLVGWSFLIDPSEQTV